MSIANAKAAADALLSRGTVELIEEIQQDLDTGPPSTERPGAPDEPPTKLDDEQMKRFHRLALIRTTVRALRAEARAAQLEAELGEREAKDIEAKLATWAQLAQGDRIEPSGAIVRAPAAGSIEQWLKG